MRIGNEYVQIKLGNKTYIKKNMILDKYLNLIFRGQINPDINNPALINCCFIKFDTPLENISYDSDLTKNDFDIRMLTSTTTIKLYEQNFLRSSERTSDKITLRYKFAFDSAFFEGDTIHEAIDFRNYIGRKITAVGFGYYEDCFAVVDTSKMNIIINNSEQIEITRVDNFQSDAKCIGFDYPLHLVNFNAYYNTNNSANEFTIAKLYSIGLGNKEGLIENEIELYDTTIGYDNIKIDFSEQIKVGHYPSEDLLPGFYPTMDNSKYLILKYRLCRINLANQITELDEYYTMSYKNDLSQYAWQLKDISFTLKIERT